MRLRLSRDRRVRMEKWKKRSVSLLASLAFGSDTSPSVVPYYPQKTEISSVERKYFNRSKPERHGICSKRLYSMLCELEMEERANILTLTALADSEVITEAARPGYDAGLWRLSHSMSKTVTGMAIGLLFDEGRVNLSDRLVDIFPEIEYKDKDFPLITVHHLLSMTAGVEFGEAGSVTECGWMSAFFASAVKFVPGSDFLYNSMNSYVLAMIVKRISGENLTDYLRLRLFYPLGISNLFWEIGPEGVEKGGWGLYLSVESWAKLGTLILGRGVFDGERILSEKWIGLSTQKQADAPEIDGDFNYAYQMWVSRDGDELLFSGMLGQNVWICPKNRIVVVITSANNEIFQDSPALEIIRRHLGADIRDRELDRRDSRLLRDKEAHFFEHRCWAIPPKARRGLFYRLGVRHRYEYDRRWDDVVGEYVFARNNVGILPLIVRGMQNNLNSTLERVKFTVSDTGLVFSFVESGIGYDVDVGFYEYKESVADFRGEKYILCALGEAREHHNGSVEYRIEILFPELPNSRTIRIFNLTRDSISIEFTETPNSRIADAFINRAASYSAIGTGLDLLERRFGDGFITRRIEDAFAPVLVGARCTSAKFEEIIAAENAKADERIRAVRLMRAFINRFFSEDGEGEVPTERRSHRFFGELIDRIRAAHIRDTEDNR